MMRPLVASLSCLVLSFSVAAEDRDRDQPYHGMEVSGAYHYVKNLVAPSGPEFAKGKPWELDLGNLTSKDPRRYNPAIAALIRRGPVVLPDLAILAQDRDWQLRARVVHVASMIGTEAGSAIVLERTRDDVRDVREIAAVGLGRAGGAGAYPRLVELLGSREPDTRRAAAQGLALLGDVRALGELSKLVNDADDLVARDIRDALAEVARRPNAVLALAELIGCRSDAEVLVLIDTAALIRDPRLCPALTQVVSGPNATLAQRAARALSVNGDSRALEALCRAASASPMPALQSEAASTLRQLTGFGAEPGLAWDLWWKQHGADATRLIPRDTLLAALHDPKRTTNKSELAAFSPDDLAPLVDGALSLDNDWWPALAFRALATDDAARWTTPLMSRINATSVPSQRLPLIILLDQLGDPAAAKPLKKLLHPDENSREPSGAERVAITVAIERRKN